MAEFLFLNDLRQIVNQANRTLSPAVFEQIRRVFIDHFQWPEVTPAGLTPEYDRQEFLQVVDEDGQPGGVEDGMLTAYRATLAAHSHFRRWFQEAVLLEGAAAGRPVLLAARWLCHLAGLRHGTVEIFIDPPGLHNFTLVQVRGLDKFEAPGAFDIPCAGHISGVDPVDEALQKELAEELNLTLDDLRDLRLVGRYNSPGSGPGDLSDQKSVINAEYRVLYRAQLAPAAVSRIRFMDGEVAGLGVFTVTELRELVRRYPERVASGLADAMGYYH